MKRKRHSPDQIVKHLREADTLLGQGRSVAQVCKRLGVTEVTYYRWRRQYDGATRDAVKKLKKLEKKNRELKQVVADQMLEIRVLKDISEGNF